MRMPNATATRTAGGWMCTVAVCATAATVSIPAAANTSSRPESMACQDDQRSAGCWAVITPSPSQALDDPERRGRVVVILGRHGLVVKRSGGRLGQLPAFPVKDRDERLHQCGAELA